MSISIFNYEDPALFLRDSWEKKRSVNKKFTVRSWATQLGISSHGTFYQMVQGKRPLPKKYVQVISTSLSLGAKESLYLETLIDFNGAKSVEHKEYYGKRLQEIAPGKRMSMYEIESFHFLKNPLNGAIIELTSLKDFVFDPAWIQNRLTISATIPEIQRSLKLMLELGLLKQNEAGKLVRTNAHIYTKQDLKNEALQEYHKNVLQLGADQISKQDVSKREYNASAFGIRNKDLPKIKEEIRTFLNDLISKYEPTDQSADEIYQLGIQFFGLTQKEKSL